MTSFGQISVEGDSIIDLRNMLLNTGIPEESTNNILQTVKKNIQATIPIPSPIPIDPSKTEAAGVPTKKKR